MLPEHVLDSLSETKNAGNLILVFVSNRKERAFSFGLLTTVSAKTLAFCSRGDGMEIRIDIQDVGFRAQAPGFKNYAKSWRLSHPEGWLWDVIDLESSCTPRTAW